MVDLNLPDDNNFYENDGDRGGINVDDNWDHAAKNEEEDDLNNNNEEEDIIEKNDSDHIQNDLFENDDEDGSPNFDKVSDIDFDTFQHDVAECTKKYIELKIRLGRNSIKKRVETLRYILDLFGDKLKDEQFFDFLGKELGIVNREEFCTYLQWSEKNHVAYGFKKNYLTLQRRQEIYDFWKTHSTLSVDRRNNRQSTKLSKKNINYLTKGLVDENLNVVEVRGREKFEAHRYIYTSPIRKLHKDFIAQYGEVSLGTFYKLKPFYLQTPTEREKESCLCITCLKVDCIYEPLKQHLKLSESLTLYLIQDFLCEYDTDIQFPHIDCIKMSCENKCKIRNDTGTLIFDEKLYNYYVFEKVPTVYYNKNAEVTLSNRTCGQEGYIA